MSEAKRIRKEKFNQALKCKLSQEEILQAGEGMANAQKELLEIEDELASIKAQFKSKVECATALIKKNANLIRDKFQLRAVECQRVFDYDEGIVTEFRTDTGDAIASRPMTDDELQMEMEMD